jgi:hypothetical protein
MDPVRASQAVCCAVLSVVLVGCGGESSPPTPAATAQAGTAQPAPGQAVNGQSSAAGTESVSKTAPASTPAVTVSIEGAVPDADAADAGDTQKAAETDEHESITILKQIQQLRAAPIAGDREAARIARRERNEQIVDLATSVLRVTMNDPVYLPQFHQGVSQLLEARFQMALAGDQADVETLYSDVQALNDRDPESVAAAEGVYYLARFAHTKAGLVGKSNPVWFETFSRWAREFADRFPQQPQRAVSLLFGAARSCELHALGTLDAALKERLTTEARLCYTTLVEKFPDSSQGQEAVAVLRRMSVPGKPLSQFSGPTVDGGFVSAEDFTGKPTLIYFWDSMNDEFETELLPMLIKLRSQLPAERLRMVGVPLDEDELEFEAFVEAQAVPGQQIFFPDAQQRAWDSPLLRYWGVSKVPSVWVVDQNRIVVTTDADAATLVSVLQEVFKKK